MKYYLLIDLGTGNSRVALGNNEGDIIDIEAFTNIYDRNTNFYDSHTFNPEELLERIIISIKVMLQRHTEVNQVEYISCDSPRQSFVLVDDSGKTIKGIPNIDNRGRDFLHHFVKDNQLCEEVYQLSGHPITEDFGALKLFATKEIETKVYDEIRYVTSISEWIAFKLTGTMCIEYTHASETQLFNISKQVFDERLCDIFRIDLDKMAPLKKSGTSLGLINQKVCDRLGILNRPEFIVGGADTQVAIKSIPKIEENDIVCISGTTSPLILIKNQPNLDMEANIWNACFLGGNKYMIEANPGVTGLNYQNFKELFAKDLSYDELEDYYSNVKIPRVISCLTSQIVMYNNKTIRGGFFLNPPNSNNICSKDFMYSILCDNICAIYEKYKLLTKKNKPKRILGCGGGFQSKNLAQNLSDLLDLPLIIPKGYKNASLQGLLNMLLDLDGVIDKRYSEKITIYNPRHYKPGINSYIEIYYADWRMKINDIK